MKFFGYFLNALATVFHPVFMLFYLLLLISYVLNEWNYNLLISGFLITILIPLLIVMLMHKDDLFLRKPENRTIPLSITVALYFFFYYVFEAQQPFLSIRLYHQDVHLFLTGIIAGTVASILINLKYKISLHASALTGFTVNLFLLYILGKNILILQLGIVFTALTLLIIYQRYLSKSHTRGQLISGMVMSMCISAIAIAYYFARMQ